MEQDIGAAATDDVHIEEAAAKDPEASEEAATEAPASTSAAEEAPTEPEPSTDQARPDESEVPMEVTNEPEPASENDMQIVSNPSSEEPPPSPRSLPRKVPQMLHRRKRPCPTLWSRRKTRRVSKWRIQI